MNTKFNRLKNFVTIAVISEILPLIFCILFYRKINTKALKVFLFYSIAQALFAVLIAVFFNSILSKSTILQLLRIHLILEFLLISYFFHLVIANKYVKKIIRFSIIPFVLFIAIDFIKNGNGEYQNAPTLIEFLFFMGLIIYYLYERMRFSIESPVYLSSIFWLSVGLFIYFSGNFFYVLLAKTSGNHTVEIQNDLALISSTVTLLKNFVLGFALTVNEPSESQDEYEFKIPLEINLDSFTPSNYLN